MNIQGLFPFGLTSLISLQSKGLKSFLQPHKFKASVLQCSTFFMVQLSHSYMTTGKAMCVCVIALTIWIFVDTVMSLLLKCCLDLSLISFQGTMVFAFHGCHHYPGFPGGSNGKESTCNVRGLGSISGSGKFPGRGHSLPLQYSCV